MRDDYTGRLLTRITLASSMLSATGWEFIASIMHDGPGDDYGRLFIHPDGRRCYVNDRTVDRVLNVGP